MPRSSITDSKFGEQANGTRNVVPTGVNKMEREFLAVFRQDFHHREAKVRLTSIFLQPDCRQSSCSDSLRMAHSCTAASGVNEKALRQ